MASIAKEEIKNETPFYGESDTDDDSDDDIAKKERKGILVRDTTHHLPQAEWSTTKIRYVTGRKGKAWLVVGEQHIFYLQELKRGLGRRPSVHTWECARRREGRSRAGTYKRSCPARATTLAGPGEALGPGVVVRLVWVWRSQEHTCSQDYRNIFEADLRDLLRVKSQEQLTANFKEIFEDAKQQLISHMEDDDLKERMNREVVRESSKKFWETFNKFALKTSSELNFNLPYKNGTFRDFVLGSDISTDGQIVTLMGLTRNATTFLQSPIKYIELVDFLGPTIIKQTVLFRADNKTCMVGLLPSASCLPLLLSLLSSFCKDSDQPGLWSSSTVVTSFSSILHTTLTTTFPGVKVVGSLRHYTRSVCHALRTE